MTGNANPAFARYIGIDYSGAATPLSSLKGLRVYQADRATWPQEVLPPPSPRKYWTRRGMAEWLVERLSEDQPTLVGIDHGFSFPLDYFEAHHLPHDWPAFLADFQRHWPTDGVHLNLHRDAPRRRLSTRVWFVTSNAGNEPIIRRIALAPEFLPMTHYLKWIDEDGVFMPLGPVQIAEHQAVETSDEPRHGADTDLPIWEFAAQLMRDAPEDVLQALPTDGASQHDHVLCDAPKRPSPTSWSPTE